MKKFNARTGVVTIGKKRLAYPVVGIAFVYASGADRQRKQSVLTTNGKTLQC